MPQNELQATNPRVIEGSFSPPKGAKFAILASRFNDFIVDRLLHGAMDGLVRHGVPAGDITIVRVPGAWELPVACSRLAKSQKFDAIIVVGAVIRGATSHYDFVAGEASKGVANAQLSTGVPVALGLLTTDTIEQAIERAGTKAGNKGWDAALSAIEMVALEHALRAADI